MTLDPILNTPLIVQLHIAAAIPSLFIGPIALFRKRRDRLHKISGYLWIIAMFALSITGFLIPSDIAIIGWIGPIHFFSLYALFGIGQGLYYIYRRNFRAHERAMRGTWFGAMGIAGLLTFLPGRTLNQALFGEPSQLGYVIIAFGLVALFHLNQRPRSDPRAA